MLETHQYLVKQSEKVLCCVAVNISTFDAVSYNFLLEKVMEAILLQVNLSSHGSHAYKKYLNAYGAIGSGIAKFEKRR